ncbi:MAG TPA: hypothetical protein VFP44_17120 [Usitatibacter sp.]|nr:hypothetical protein [Usitatibacter sp.]
MPTNRTWARSLAVALVLGLAACGAIRMPSDSLSDVGYTSLSVPDPGDQPLEVGVWYPTDARPSVVDMGLSRQLVAQDGAVAGHGLALIVMSHGNGGGFGSHADTAVALAAAGFVVAAPNHTGDNFRDESYVGTARWLPDRTRHLKMVTDYMLRDWPHHARLDGRVGMFGFSAGAFTALVAIGGAPDLRRVAANCAARPEPACTLWAHPPATSPPSEAWVRDRRISAAIVAAPGLGFTFEPDGLEHLGAAVQLWSGADDRIVPYATNTAIVLRQLRRPLDYHEVPRAGHMSFITPCKPEIRGPLCRDADGFDRAAFHADLNRSAVDFYRAHLEVR